MDHSTHSTFSSAYTIDVSSNFPDSSLAVLSLKKNELNRLFKTSLPVTIQQLQQFGNSSSSPTFPLLRTHPGWEVIKSYFFICLQNSPSLYDRQASRHDAHILCLDRNVHVHACLLLPHSRRDRSESRYCTPISRSTMLYSFLQCYRWRTVQVYKCNKCSGSKWHGLFYKKLSGESSSDCQHRECRIWTVASQAKWQVWGPEVQQPRWMGSRRTEAWYHTNEGKWYEARSYHQQPHLSCKYLSTVATWFVFKKSQSRPHHFFLKGCTPTPKVSCIVFCYGCSLCGPGRQLAGTNASGNASAVVATALRETHRRLQNNLPAFFQGWLTTGVGASLVNGCMAPTTLTVNVSLF